MSIDILANEKLLPVYSALEQRLNYRPSGATLHRWRLSGVRGVRLPCVKVGHSVRTSIEAVGRWLEATQPEEYRSTPTSTATAKKRAKQIAVADKRARQAGV